jgi:hypothetical protein
MTQAQAAPKVTVLATDFEGWSEDLHTEMQRHEADGRVGSRLLLENSRVRVWEIRLAAGQKWHFHRHALDYFWTAVNPGTSIQHSDDGQTLLVDYQAGDTVYSSFAEGDYKVHDLLNAGSTELVFTTVELVESPNARLVLDSADD